VERLGISQFFNGRTRFSVSVGFSVLDRCQTSGMKYCPATARARRVYFRRERATRADSLANNCDLINAASIRE